MSRFTLYGMAWDQVGVTALFTVVGGAVGAALEGLRRILNDRTQATRQRRTDAIGEYQAVIEQQVRHGERQQEQITRLEEHVQEQAIVIQELSAINAEYRANLTLFKGQLVHLHLYAARLCESLSRAGVVADPPPPLADMPAVMPPDARSDFLERTMQMNAAILKEMRTPNPEK